ncbi:MAG TPA: cation-transporting P-type ATPase [candidate division Zixibacteria bacterium]|nr:cation-transporting P-type ATPase [candidate division Zixibacteria bacterium]HEQ98538.1 cation-transporting P-type ATPase [candidate division Zixibacteria bacterium]
MANTKSDVRVNKDSREPWRRGAEELLRELDVDRNKGLSSSEAAERQSKFGKNLLREVEERSIWSIFADQFKSLVILILAVASALSFIFGEVIQGFAVAGAILINALIGFFTELKAVKSMQSLREMSKVTTKVRRDGEAKNINAREIVPGDIVILEGGDIVTADMRLLEANKLQLNESALTGESMPVSKQVEALDQDVPLAERSNMLFKGTAVTRGSGEGLVISTGMNTELGEISELVEAAGEDLTPLEKRLNRLGHSLIWVTLAVAAVVAVTGILRGKELVLMIETSVALAVAAIPEGLPIVATIALARGMMRMARRNALVNRLASVETLGATNVICTDKTGTLTENEMTVTKLILETGEIKITEDRFEDSNGPIDEPSEALKKALIVGVLCNNASLSRGNTPDSDSHVGDPIEVAILEAADKLNYRRSELLEQMPEEREEAFDPDTKMMATFNRNNGGYMVSVKGAPESVFEVCTNVLAGDDIRNLDNADRWEKLNNEMAEDGLRVLALAFKQSESPDANPYNDLTLIGLMGFTDPPREDVKDSIKVCHKAGIRVIMVTGDQEVTARNVGEQVGLVENDNAAVMKSRELHDVESLSDKDKERIINASIFARVSPRQKLDLISIHQENNSIVAMTGDGVNDAPALKKADIGIAMGRRGTQVAREAADMILKDDAFSTIVAAVQQGRVIFDNIRKFVIYLLSGNSSEIIAVGAASLANAPLPLMPLQILFLNLVLDVFPALALGVGEGDPRIMNRRPRPADEPVLGWNHWGFIGAFGLLIAASVLAAFAIAINWLKLDTGQAVTVSFLTLAFARLWHVFNMRDLRSGFISNEITRNVYVWGALFLCTVLLLSVVYIPGPAKVIGVVPLDLKRWALILPMSLIPWIAGQIYKSVGGREK